jgi:predicted nucleic acid-binding protein
LIYLFDACALLAYIKQDPEGGLKVKEFLDRARAGEVTIRMSIINLCEVYYGLIRDDGAEIADEIMRGVSRLPLAIIDTVSETVYRAAARFKAGYSMSLADAFLCATAKSLNATLVTKDREIEPAEQPELLSVLWIT